MGDGKGKDSKGKDGKDKGVGKGSMKGILKGAIKTGITPWGERPDENCLYIKGLPDDCTDRDLYELCAPSAPSSRRGYTPSTRMACVQESAFATTWRARLRNPQLR